MAKMMDFPGLVKDGENPNGVRTEGAFGIGHGGIGEDYYTQWSFGANSAGPRWGGKAPEVVPPGIGVLGVDADSGMENKGKTLKGGN